MPLRDFKCQKCGAIFEELCLRKGEKVKCPKCGGKKLEILFSPFAFSRGGSGVSSCSSCQTKKCSQCR
ncbi:MAG: FmdB family zinc ribbon protein [candidate division WOR-3 bacterium]